MLKFSVADTGIGIPRAGIERLFQAFNQVDGSTTRRYGGTGLGLVICKQLAELMGGEIGVASEPGQGATFWFTAKLAIGAAAADVRAIATAVAAAGCTELGRANAERVTGLTLAPAASVTQASEPATARILLAEDNAVNQEVACAMLRHLGYEVDVAQDGAQALTLLARGDFDAILMDCQMPEMDGFAASREIRDIEARSADKRRLPIIALTANAMEGDRERCIEAGMDDYLAKPFKAAELGAMLARWLPWDSPRRGAAGEG